MSWQRNPSIRRQNQALLLTELQLPMRSTERTSRLVWFCTGSSWCSWGSRCFVFFLFWRMDSWFGGLQLEQSKKHRASEWLSVVRCALLQSSYLFLWANVNVQVSALWTAVVWRNFPSAQCLWSLNSLLFTAASWLFRRTPDVSVGPAVM